MGLQGTTATPAATAAGATATHAAYSYSYTCSYGPFLCESDTFLFKGTLQAAQVHPTQARNSKYAHFLTLCTLCVSDVRGHTRQAN